MIYGILVVSAVIFLCILANKFSDKFGMPTFNIIHVYRYCFSEAAE